MGFIFPYKLKLKIEFSNIGYKFKIQSSPCSQNILRFALDPKDWCFLSCSDTQIVQLSISGSFKPSIYSQVRQLQSELCSCWNVSLKSKRWSWLICPWPFMSWDYHLSPIIPCIFVILTYNLLGTELRDLAYFPKGFQDNDFECLVQCMSNWLHSSALWSMRDIRQKQRKQCHKEIWKDGNLTLQRIATLRLEHLLVIIKICITQ